MVAALSTDSGQIDVVEGIALTIRKSGGKSHVRLVGRQLATSVVKLAVTLVPILVSLRSELRQKAK